MPARRTKKQIAATRKLVRLNKSKRKVNKRKSSNRRMVRRRRSIRRGSRRVVRTVRRGSRRLGGVKSIVDVGAKSIGYGTIFSDVAKRFAPQAAPVAELAGQFVGGGVKGTAIAQVEGVLAGRPSVISGFTGNLFGGGQQQSNSVGAVV